ncbi:MAG: hypothetical protein GXO78_08730, partial [Calditrichaeota bacterium]|nr:hypothetical protein [Calditrichota bacterium]
MRKQLSICASILGMLYFAIAQDNHQGKAIELVQKRPIEWQHYYDDYDDYDEIIFDKKSREIHEEYDKLFFLRFNTMLREVSGRHTVSTEIQTPKTIIEDFQVNENAGPKGTVQWNPSIAMQESGGTIIVWADWRNGDWDIYAQRYTAQATPLGDNFRVNDDENFTAQKYPSVATNSRGNFVVVWTDNREGNRDIYAQRYASDGTPIGNNFKVNDDSGSATQIYPSVGINDSGEIIIAWVDKRNGNWDIYAQQYDADGNPVGSNFRVNDDSLNAAQKNPSVGIDNYGHCVIVWVDWRNKNSDIYSQLYTIDGLPIGNNFKVNDDTSDANQTSPFLCINGSGRFVVVWADKRRNGSKIYAQIYSTDGGPLGSNFLVDNDSDFHSESYPSVDINDSGQFIVAWEDWRNNNPDIYLQRFTADGVPLGSNFQANIDDGNFDQNYPTIGVGNSGEFIVAWEDKRNDEGDIYAQRF